MSPITPADPAPTPRWRAWLEDAHAALERACFAIVHQAEPEADLSDAARRFDVAFASLYDAIDGRSERVDAVRRAMQAVDAAGEELRRTGDRDPVVARTLEQLRDVRAALGAGEDALASAPALPAAVVAPLRASTGSPNVQWLARASLAPALRFPEPPPVEVIEPVPDLPKPRNVAELAERMAEVRARAAAQRAASEARRAERDAERERARLKPPPPQVPEGFGVELPERLGEDDFVRQRAREHFEEVVLVGLHRAPILGESWRAAEIPERRMLQSMDAIASLGERAVASLEPLVLDSPARDPARIFGLTMVLGSQGGRDALAAAERVFLATEKNDEAARDAFAAALKIAPHPEIPVLARSWLTAPSAKHRALALDVLAYRDLASDEELLRMAKDAPEVASIALAALALRGAQGTVAAIEAALGRADVAELRPAAFFAMTLAGHPHAARALREALEGPPLGPDADRVATLFALQADDRDAQNLLDLALARPCRPFVSALGWAGAVPAVQKLIELLEHEEKEVVYAAAFALERITGAGLWETLQVPAEEIDVPEPPTPEVEPKPKKLVRVVSDPRDLPPEPSKEDLRQPTSDPARWKAFWAEKGKDFRPGARYRRGKPASPAVMLYDLDWGELTPGERRFAYWELVIRTGERVRFDVHDFVPVQTQSLMGWEPIALRTSGAAGSWSRPPRRAG